MDALQTKAISSSLYDFSFSKDNFTFDNTTFFAEDPVAIDDDDDNEPAGVDDGFGYPTGVEGGMDADGDMNMGDQDAVPPVEDFFVGDQAAGDDYVNDYEAGSPNTVDDEGGENGIGEENGAGGSYVPFDPRRGPGGNLMMAEQTAGDIMFDYFAQSVKKNWAGPEHWKLRKPVRRREYRVDLQPQFVRYSTIV